MFNKKKYIKRSFIDRRSPIDRRTIDLGPKYPNLERRTKQERRQGWEARQGWKPVNRWSSSPINFEIRDTQQDSYLF
jgi:hypothetical protein